MTAREAGRLRWKRVSKLQRKKYARKIVKIRWAKYRREQGQKAS